MKIQWKWGVIAALAVTLLSLYPQIYLLIQQGRSWAGSYAFVDTDEVAYSAYLQAIIDRNSRNCNPYIQAEYEPSAPLPESLFSIQFLPAYAAAVPARLLHLSASSVFVLLNPIASILASLALFWLLTQVLQNSELSAVGVVTVLCLPSLVSAEGPIGAAFLGSTHAWAYLTFLRRYVPAIPFPFFLVLFALTWRPLTKPRRSPTEAICAGLCVAILMFSYFFLWTAAIAWLVCVGICWTVFRPTVWRRCLYFFSIVFGIVLCAAVPYVILLSRRAPEMDHVQALVLTHAPDLFRPSEVLCFALVLVMIWFAIKKRISVRDETNLFTLSLLITPILIFNQQIVTGRSLQAFHYEQFVTSYMVLIALMLLWQSFVTSGVLSRAAISPTLMLALTIFSMVYSSMNLTAVTRAASDDNLFRDRNVAVATHLKQASQTSPGIVISLNPRFGDSLPTLAPLPQLWAAHMAVFPGVTKAELKERFYQYLYYSDVNPDTLRKLLTARDYMVSSALFGFEREAQHLTSQNRSITADEIEVEARTFAEYCSSFNPDRARRYPLHYLVASGDSKLQNINRWYTAYDCETTNDLVLCRLELRL